MKGLLRATALDDDLTPENVARAIEALIAMEGYQTAMAQVEQLRRIYASVDTAEANRARLKLEKAKFALAKQAGGDMLDITPPSIEYVIVSPPETE